MSCLNKETCWNALKLARAMNIPYHHARKCLKILKKNQTEIQPQENLGFRKTFDLEDVRFFLNKFPEFKRRNLNLNQMFQEMRGSNAKFKSLSRSAFYKCFIRGQRLVFRLPKLQHALFKEEKKKETRPITTCLIFSVMSSL